MAKTALELTAAELNRYNPTKHWQQSLAPERWEKAWALVPQLAALLREQFGATRVAVFGSLTDRDRYTRWSDIDLAAWDIPVDRFYRAAIAVAEISPEFQVDLVDPNGCRPSIQQAIAREGIDV